MTADDRKTLEELHDLLQEHMVYEGSQNLAQFIPALSRVLEEPTEAELIAWGLANGQLPHVDGRPVIVRSQEAGVGVWNLVHWRTRIDLGSGPLPVLSPEAREILVREWRRANAVRE